MRVRNSLATVAFCLTVASPAQSMAANTWGTDMSDLWWVTSEGGWGLEIMHEQDTIFLVMYVYGADNRSRWYASSSMTPTSTSGGSYVFVGPLYEYNGPPFFGSFSSAAVGTRQVGTATLNLRVRSGTITYSIDGATVSKNIERFGFKNNNLTGSYYGAAIGSATGCGTNSGNFEDTSAFSVSHSGSSVAIAANLSNGISCTYSGAYSQYGRMGEINGGTFNCSNGSGGTFRGIEVEASYLGFFLRYTADYGGGCTEQGRIGGMKR